MGRPAASMVVSVSDYMFVNDLRKLVILVLDGWRQANIAAAAVGFAAARQTTDCICPAWARIQRELSLFGRVVDPGDQVEPKAPGHG